MEKCHHSKLVVVYVTGKKSNNDTFEKDLLISCSDPKCNKELFRTSVYGKEVINLLPNCL